MSRRTAAAHVCRPAPRRARAMVAHHQAAPVYPPGYFLALVRKHDWPPRFESVADFSSQTDMLRTRSAQLGRAMAQAQGLGWGNGTIPMLGTPIRLAPGNMGGRHAGR
jgi:hypothetical protein